MTRIALESTVITHGLPYPDNLHLAHEMERIIRHHGADPRHRRRHRRRTHRRPQPPADRAPGRDLRTTDRQSKPPRPARRRRPQARRRHHRRRHHVDRPPRRHRNLRHRRYRRRPPQPRTRPQHRRQRRPAGTGPYPAHRRLRRRKSNIGPCRPRSNTWKRTGVTVIGYGTEEFPAFYSRSSGLPVDICCNTPQEVAAKSGGPNEGLDLAGGAARGGPCSRRGRDSRPRRSNRRSSRRWQNAKPPDSAQPR